MRKWKAVCGNLWKKKDWKTQDGKEEEVNIPQVPLLFNFTPWSLFFWKRHLLHTQSYLHFIDTPIPTHTIWYTHNLFLTFSFKYISILTNTHTIVPFVIHSSFYHSFLSIFPTYHFISSHPIVLFFFFSDINGNFFFAFLTLII
jgi:hypothetical protein